MKQFLIALVVIITLALPGGLTLSQDTTSLVDLATVTRVIDGDTIEVQFNDGSRDTIRYIGIDTPESGATCGRDATQANRSLVDGQTVALLRDISNRDRYDRLLRYVYVDDLFVNAALVANGWAVAVEYPPDTAFAAWFNHLEEQAETAGIGCYALDAFGVEITTTATAAPIGVTVTATNTVNLRGGPGTNYNITGSLEAGQSREAQARNGDWLYLGNSQWVASWVVTVEGDMNSLSTRDAPPAPAPAAQPAQPPAQVTTAPPAGPSFTCDCSKPCSAMASCDEAYFQLNQCGCSRRDGDGDGVPCESICPGG